MSLAGKTILILGAGGLLGRRVVSRVSGAGAFVIAADLEEEGLLARIGALPTVVDVRRVDVTKPDEVSALIDAPKRLDGVVNCTYPRNANYGREFLSVSAEDFAENVRLHLGSAFLVNQACVQRFIRTPAPLAVVNIASIYGVCAPRFELYADMPFTMPVEYAAIKSAIIHLTKYVAAYVRDARFRVNCVSPGGIFADQPKEFVERYARECKGKGLLEPDDVAGPIAFLLSDEARGMTGHNLVVDDGFTT